MLSKEEIATLIQRFARKIGIVNADECFTFDVPVGDATPMLRIEDGTET